MCSAYSAAFAHAAGPKGVSRSGPIQSRVLETLCRKLVFPIRPHDPPAIPSMVLFGFRRLTAADALRVGSWSLVDVPLAPAVFANLSRATRPVLLELRKGFGQQTLTTTKLTERNGNGFYI